MEDLETRILAVLIRETDLERAQCDVIVHEIMKEINTPLVKIYSKALDILCTEYDLDTTKTINKNRKNFALESALFQIEHEGDDNGILF